MDVALIILLAAAVTGVVIYIYKTKKAGGCASCPYNDSCPSAKKGGDCEDFKGRDKK